METNKKSGGKSRKKKKSSSEEVVERHLHDPSDVITVEDIQNVEVPPTDEQEELTTVASTEDETNPVDTKSDKKKEDKSETIPEKEIVTPWDVIDP